MLRSSYPSVTCCLVQIRIALFQTACGICECQFWPYPLTSKMTNLCSLLILNCTFYFWTIYPLNQLQRYGGVENIINPASTRVAKGMYQKWFHVYGFFLVVNLLVFICTLCKCVYGLPFFNPLCSIDFLFVMRSIHILFMLIEELHTVMNPKSVLISMTRKVCWLSLVCF
jgi:hypothetical protein